MSKKGVFYSLAEQGAYSLGNFVVGVIIARNTNLEIFGQYVLMMMIIIILIGFQTSVQSLPMRVLTDRSLVKGKFGRYYEQNRLNQLFSFLALLISFTGAFIFLGRDLATSGAFGLTSMLVNRHEFARANLILDHDFHASAIFQMTLLMFRAFLVWVAVSIFVNPLLGLFLGAATAYLIVNFLMYIKLRKRRSTSGALRLDRLRVVLLRNWRFGKWLLIETVALMASAQIYLIVLSVVSGDQSSGVYGAIQNLLNSINVVYLGISSYVLQLSRQKYSRERYQEWKRIFIGTASLFFVIGIITIFIFTLWGANLLTLVYGSEYKEYGQLMAIFSIALALRGMNIVWNSAYRSVSDSITGAKAKMVSAFISIIISVPLVREFSIIGAAFGLIVTQISWFVIYSFFARTRLLRKVQ